MAPAANIADVRAVETASSQLPLVNLTSELQKGTKRLGQGCRAGFGEPGDSGTGL